MGIQLIKIDGSDNIHPLTGRRTEFFYYVEIPDDTKIPAPYSVEVKEGKVIFEADAAFLVISLQNKGTKEVQQKNGNKYKKPVLSTKRFMVRVYGIRIVCDSLSETSLSIEPEWWQDRDNEQKFKDFFPHKLGSFSEDL